MLRRVALLTLAVAACGGSARGPANAVSSRHRPTGATLLAQPGPGLAYAPTAVDVVRGRVRYHLDADGGATRARDVLAESVAQAVALPPALGGGLALIGDAGIAIATSTLKPIVRGSLTAVSAGVGELWARERGTTDWVRIDLVRGRATHEPPPIAAPILTTWSVMGATSGKPQTTGPEFATATFALAIVDLLGPVLTRDGGQTWSPLDAAAVRAAFPVGAPNRVLRDGTTLLLGSDDRLVPVSSSGALGAPVVGPPVALIPDNAALRIEQLAPFGVPLPLPNEDVLIADGSRLGILELEPVRVVHATRAPEITRCDLSPSKSDLALAACLRHQDGLGSQLAVGTIVDASSPRFVADKTFPYGTAHRFSATSAVVVAASCAGTNDGGIDLLAASRLCVRDSAGKWGEVAVSSVSARRHVLPRADGGVLIVRDDEGARTEILSLPRGAGPTTTPLRLRLDTPTRDIVSIDEISPGRFRLWRRSALDLRALTIEVSDTAVQLGKESPRVILDASASVGTYGDRAMIASLVVQPKEPARLEASITTDGGRTWSLHALPENVRPLDASVSGRRIECGAAGCRLFGWTRIGWHPVVSSHDRIVTLEEAPVLAATPTTVTRAKKILAKCSSLAAPLTVTSAAVPVAGPSYPQQPNDVLLGLPLPKLGKDQAHALTAFTSRNVRGGFVTVGPLNGPWADKARSFARFASDLDPLGTVYESQTFVAPFADRFAAQMAWGAARQFDAFAIGPGRLLAINCLYGRCEVQRLAANAPPERVDLGGVAMVRFINAREAGGTLAILGTGVRRELAASGRVVDPIPFVAIIDARGTTVSYFARADDTALSLTVDPTRGVFGVRSSSRVPSWTEGTSYVLPLGISGSPAGAFEKLVAPTAEISRPTKACGPSAVGWDEADIAQTRVLHVRIDGAEPLVLAALGGALRTRVSSSSVCLDRVTALSRGASFQLDTASGRATLFALETDGKSGKRSELMCSLEWE